MCGKHQTSEDTLQLKQEWAGGDNEFRLNGRSIDQTKRNPGNSKIQGNRYQGTNRGGHVSRLLGLYPRAFIQGCKPQQTCDRC